MMHGMSHAVCRHPWRPGRRATLRPTRRVLLVRRTRAGTMTRPGHRCTHDGPRRRARVRRPLAKDSWASTACTGESGRLGSCQRRYRRGEVLRWIPADLGDRQVLAVGQPLVRRSAGRRDSGSSVPLGSAVTRSRAMDPPNVPRLVLGAARERRKDPALVCGPRPRGRSGAVPRA